MWAYMLTMNTLKCGRAFRLSFISNTYIGSVRLQLDSALPDCEHAVFWIDIMCNTISVRRISFRHIERRLGLWWWPDLSHHIGYDYRFSQHSRDAREFSSTVFKLDYLDRNSHKYVLDVVGWSWLRCFASS